MKSKHRTMESVRQELGIVSQGRVTTDNSVLFHLAFRLDVEQAKVFIKTAADQETSESLLARKLIVHYLKQIGVKKI